MMSEPDRAFLREKLRLWQAGVIDEVALHAEAERLMESREWPGFEKTDDQSIAMEVLTQLDALNVQLIIRDDIAAILAFLDTPSGESLAGWRDWQRYWDSVDFKKRQSELINHPYYVAGSR